MLDQVDRGHLICLGLAEILRGGLKFIWVSDFQSLRPSLTDFTTVISEFKRNHGSGATAQEPQQNPVLVFSVTLTQKRVGPPVWIILVPHAELDSVRALSRL